MIDIPLYVSEILNVFYSNGYEAFLVGGCVRDSLLGNKPKDYDITTNAKPETIKSLLNNFKTIDTGIDFGTVTAISDGHPIEITTYRIDGDYFDNRRPENVIYTQELKEDLKRRDFTVNSMAFSPGTGLIDLFDGVFISDVIGFEKPTREFFKPVLEELKYYNKEEIIIVGDSLTSDMQGGNNIGISCCWYNPEHKVNDKEINIDFEIDDLNQLMYILDKEL